MQNKHAEQFHITRSTQNITFDKLKQFEVFELRKFLLTTNVQFCVLQGQPTMWVKHLWGDLEPVSGRHCFEPTLSGRSMIHTIHGFTAGVFTPPSGEQGRLRRTNNPEEHTLAGSRISLVAFRILRSLSKVPLKNSNP